MSLKREDLEKNCESVAVKVHEVTDIRMKAKPE